MVLFQTWRQGPRGKGEGGDEEERIDVLKMREQDWEERNALCVFVNGELGLGFLELSLSFYGRPNISDRFTFHFIRIQIFQIDFPLILYL